MKSKDNFYRVLFLLLTLTAAGQITNTVYVPALADIARDLHVKPGSMQAVISCFLFPYGLFQFIYGPYSDYYGRKPLILIGTVIFAIGSFVAYFSNNFDQLLLGSLLQGSGIAVGGVMARTVMRDLYSAKALQSANSYMAIALIFAPLLAPILGGFLTDTFSWRAIFAFLTVYAVILFIIQLKFFKETNQNLREKRPLIEKYKVILSSRNFVVNLMLLVIALGGIAIFEVSSGAIFTSLLGLSPTEASFVFILPLPAYMLGSYLANKLASYMSIFKLLNLGSYILVISSLLMILWYHMLGVSLAAVIIPGIIYFLGCGIVFPSATTQALEEFPTLAGTAGSLLGGIQNVGAGILTAVAALIPLKSQLPLAVILSTLAIFAVLILFSTKKSLDIKGNT
ncbi:Bcr/CflA family efflux MFS transporter [Thiotrichales bacterium 19S3-7]|nr:Bcr/CflA family efflux MFS transporter [Thiotrichales bacterium 19S3-7]MCF6801732.1 Bcr/CflA family efflux MFS transporter [Thiotrichales bacterium 19S3-11]